MLQFCGVELVGQAMHVRCDFLCHVVEIRNLSGNSDLRLDRVLETL